MYPCAQTQQKKMCHARPSAPCTRNDLSSFPLAMTYTPMQQFQTVYDIKEALKYGTIFPELNKPFMGWKGGCRF